MKNGGKSGGKIIEDNVIENNWSAHGPSLFG